MTKQAKMDWQDYRARYETTDTVPRVSPADVKALLDSREAAIKCLNEIIKFCPARPGKPFAKRILEMAKTGIKEAQS